MATQKELEKALSDRLKKEKDIPEWESRFCFNQPDNGMTFDFAWPEYKFAIEVNGGQWSKGKMGHNSGAGVQRDAEKNNWAIFKGWTLLVFVTDHIEKVMDTYTIPTIRQIMLLRNIPIRDIDKEIIDLFLNTEELQ